MMWPARKRPSDERGIPIALQGDGTPNGYYKAASLPAEPRGLAPGVHRITIRAVDEYGQADSGGAVMVVWNEILGSAAQITSVRSTDAGLSWSVAAAFATTGNRRPDAAIDVDDNGATAEKYDVQSISILARKIA